MMIELMHILETGEKKGTMRIFPNCFIGIQVRNNKERIAVAMITEVVCYRQIKNQKKERGGRFREGIGCVCTNLFV